METIGFIGLGLMGKPMAENILRANYRVVVHNRSRAAVDALVAQGAVAAQSARDAAAQSDILITMLPGPASVASVLGHEGGGIENARADSIVIDMSTSEPQLARELAALGKTRSVAVLDAPVSGGTVGARDATLSIMVGGDADAFARALPIFQVLGKNIVRVGDAGAGQVVKAANQLIVGITIGAVAEALVLTERAGVNPALARQVMLGGFAASRILDLHGQRMLDKNFEPGGRATTQRKDLGIALDEAGAHDLNLPLTQHVANLYDELLARDFGNEDHAALWRMIARDWA